VLRLFAWTGGALFVGSLAYGAYFYAAVLARVGQPEHAWLAALANVALFALFACHHSILAQPAVKQLVTRFVPAAAERSLYVWCASLLWLLLCAAWQSLPGVVYAVEGAGRWPLYATQWAGVWLTIKSAAAIHPLELSGIAQAAGTTRAAALMVDGPFRIVRHPIYLAWLLMVFATPLMTVNRLLFAVVSSSYLVMAIPWEERSLLTAFGDRYRAYQRQVRWHLLPGIW